MLRAGTQVGDFVIESALGEGGMAQVYLARHPLLDTRHAIKILDPQLRANADARQRFLDEARIQAKHLDHPGIVKVTYVIATEEHAALVMEFVDGPSLESEVSTLARRPDEVRRIMLSVLDAVGHAHAAGIVHRDLKPANILLAGPARRPKVTDFGIAKVSVDLRRSGKKSTRAEARMGTLNYSSPEQVLSAKDVTPRSDIWSLGVILYELATGVLPFDAENDYALMDQIVKGRCASAETVNPRIDPRFAAVIRRALDVDPRRRFATCAEMAEALQAPAQTPPLHRDERAVIDLSSERTPPAHEARSWRVFAIALSLGGVVVVVGLTAYLIQGRAAPTNAGSPAPSRSIEQRVKPIRVTASSTMKAFGGYSFDPSNLVDGKVSTSWQPSSPELRNGATWVQFDLPNEVSLSAIRIANGFQTTDKNGDEFVLNSRIAVARAVLSDGTSFALEFSGAERGFVRFNLPAATPTRTVRVVIDSIHRGAPRPTGSRLSDDLAISEIELLAPSAPPSGVPSLRSTDWDAKLAAENKGPFEMGPPSVDEVIYGDLDGDGSEEAVVRSMIPDFKSQALDVYALRGGAVVKIGTIDGGWRTEGGVDTIQIRDGFLFVERTHVGPDDPMSDPSIMSSERWFVSGGLLKEDSAFRKTRKR